METAGGKGFKDRCALCGVSWVSVQALWALWENLELIWAGWG